jgi:hypothetical protein
MILISTSGIAGIVDMSHCAQQKYNTSLLKERKRKGNCRDKSYLQGDPLNI